jgi:chemotaxis protein MotA
MDFLTLLGLIVAAAGILGGQALEGGHVSSILQPTAALIVGGGTLGAVLVSYPLSHVLAAVTGAKHVLFEAKWNPDDLISLILGLAKKARKEGIISLEAEAEKIDDHFLKKALSLVADGTDPKLVKDTLETEVSYLEEYGEHGAKVFESAGGYAPTIGILGAVLGLIHVMENLSDPSKLGAGIATAFVATVYGVGGANLILLPFATKLKVRHRQEIIRKELAMTGVLSIQAGENPRLIEEKLRALLSEKSKKGPAAAPAHAGSGATAAAKAAA